MPRRAADGTAAPNKAREIAGRLATQRRWCVFPVRFGDKRPAPGIKWGTVAASVPKPEYLDRLFGPEPMNVGIGCRGSGLVVLDDDTGDAMERLCEAYGKPMPITYRVRTAKGWHYYFDAPVDIEISNAPGLLAEFGFDVRGNRGDGGYVVAAGSTHESGHLYAAEDDDADTVELPHWIVELLLAETHSADGMRVDSTSNSGSDRRFTAEQAREYIRRYGAKPLEDAREGQRNNALNAAAVVVGHFVPELFSERRARQHLAKMARDAGLDEHEIGPTITSGMRAGMAEPYEIVEGEEDLRSTQATDDEHPLGSWLPRDLDDALAGRKERALPTMGIVRNDGVRLIYPAKEHAVMGETEAGKSWFALACAVAEMEAGNRVLYVHFEEEDEEGTVTRLMMMGADHGMLRKLFLFVGPSARITPKVVDYFAANPPSLVILDGQNEGMALHAQKIREEDGASAYREALVKPFTKMGAAVMSLDHVVKNREQRGEGMQIGSVMKTNGLSGVAILLENREAFGEERAGVSRVYVTKDRPGSLRKEGLPYQGNPRKTYMGDMRIESYKGASAVTFWKPSERAEGEVADSFEQGVINAVAELVAGGHEASMRKVRAKVGGNAKKIDEAVDRLVVSGQLIEARVGQARVLTVSDLTVSEDQE